MLNKKREMRVNEMKFPVEKGMMGGVATPK
jgi:hypothetical protein